MKNVLGSLVTFVCFGLLAAVWLPVMAVLWLLTAPFDRDRRVVGRALRLCAVAAGACCPLWGFYRWGVSLPRGPFVAVANHESMADPFLLARLPREMKWLAKASLFRIPWVGWMFRLAGDIPVRRGDHVSGERVMARAAGYLRRGVPVMVFPEGTRSATGELLPFKTGAFRLAIEAGVPVVPIAIHGSRDALPPGAGWLRSAQLVAKVLAPIDVKGLGPDDAKPLADRVRAIIAAARDEIDRVLREPPEPTPRPAAVAAALEQAHAPS